MEQKIHPGLIKILAVHIVVLLLTPYSIWWSQSEHLTHYS